MDKWMKEYCDFLSEIYNCTYYVKNNILFIKSNNEQNSTFKVSLNDKDLPCYTLFHKNSYKIKESYHTQYKSKNLKKVIFTAMAHDFYKENNLFYNDEDFYRTITDTTKYINNKEIQNKYKNMVYINCPICKRKLKVLSGRGGGIRKTIHCRCKLNNRHNHIEYIYNDGYYLMYRDKHENKYKKLLSKPI